MLHDTLGFPPHEGLPWISSEPLVDGFVQPDPGISMPPNFIEAGYVNGGRFLYGGDAGVQTAAIDCVRHNSQPLLYLGIVTRLNLSFNDNDFVMIVIRPGGPGGNAADDLRLHIKPVSSGADGASPAIANPLEPGDTPQPAPGAPAGPVIRGNRSPAFATVFYKRSGLAAPARKWVTTAAPANFAVKVRSTKTGDAKNWSVELQIPTNGGGNWVALQSNFGLYVNTGRPFLSDGNGYIDQTPWPHDPSNPDQNVVTDDPNYPYAADFLDNWDIPATGMIGTGVLVTSQNSNPAKGVKFKGSSDGIGVLSGTTIISNLDTTVGVTNRLVARVLNTAASAAQGIRATFRVANFGINGPLPNGADWRKVAQLPNPPQPNPTPGVTVPAAPASGTPPSQDITLDWTITQQDHDDLRSWNHTCMWVELDSNAATAVSITESSVRRNLLYVGMSDVDRNSVVDGRGFGKSRSGNGMHDIILQVVRIPVPRRKADRSRDRDSASRFYDDAYGPLFAGHVELTPGSKETVGWISIVKAHLVTDKVLTIDARKHRVVIGGGSYGFVAEHVLEPGETAANVGLTHVLEGRGVVDHGGGVYRVSVPENDVLKLRNRLKTVRIESKPVDDRPTRSSWIWRWLEPVRRIFK